MSTRTDSRMRADAADAADVRRDLELAGSERSGADDALLAELRAAGIGNDWMWER